MRSPIAAGLMYPNAAEQLVQEIRACLEHSHNPQATPTAAQQSQNNRPKIKAILVPHSHYQLAALCMASAYKELAETETPDTPTVYIMLGADTRNQGTCISTEDWQTPLGDVSINRELAKQLVRAGIKEDNTAHQQEHSIEVQLPFLQYINKHPFTIVPIIVGSDFRNCADIIHREIANRNSTNTIIIASTDFTRYGFKYSFRPFSTDITKNIKMLDDQAIIHIRNLDILNFLLYCRETKANISGKYAVVVLIDLLKRMGATQAQLLHYTNSAEINHDLNNITSFASMVFR